MEVPGEGVWWCWAPWWSKSSNGRCNHTLHRHVPYEFPAKIGHQSLRRNQKLKWYKVWRQVEKPLCCLLLEALFPFIYNKQSRLIPVSHTNFSLLSGGDDETLLIFICSSPMDFGLFASWTSCFPMHATHVYSVLVGKHTVFPFGKCPNPKDGPFYRAGQYLRLRKRASLVAFLLREMK